MKKGTYVIACLVVLAILLLPMMAYGFSEAMCSVRESRRRKDIETNVVEQDNATDTRKRSLRSDNCSIEMNVVERDNAPALDNSRWGIFHAKGYQHIERYSTRRSIEDFNIAVICSLKRAMRYFVILSQNSIVKARTTSMRPELHGLSASAMLSNGPRQF